MALEVIQTNLPGVLIIEPRVFVDGRGSFFESYNQRNFQESLGLDVEFVQDNHSLSAKNVLRGLHYQIQRPQGKLVRVICGEIFDVAVDLREESVNFGKHVGIKLSAKNKLQLWIPPGFAHGFLCLQDNTEVLYKTTDYWFPELEKCIIWNDQTLEILWPISELPIVSQKDLLGQKLQRQA